MRLATEGVPLAGPFECSFAAVKQRERHDNASLTPEAIAHVERAGTTTGEKAKGVLSCSVIGGLH